PTTLGACDSIVVELRDSLTPLVVDASIVAVLNQNGTATCIFPPMTGSKYIIVKHRSAVQTWSASPVAMVPNITYDFSNAALKAYGSNQVDVSGNGTIWAFFSGDINQDDNIDLIDNAYLESDINDFLYGYQVSDLDGDGNVDLLDWPLLEINGSNFIFSNHP
ncbi:MAG: hypothetical protein IPI46_08025, partial [Bacteroidetes bacterium]|nr:hypothetical protein [Bacteroidota bacterium]